jgi:hypothetical protein
LLVWRHGSTFPARVGRAAEVPAGRRHLLLPRAACRSRCRSRAREAPRRRATLARDAEGAVAQPVLPLPVKRARSRSSRGCRARCGTTRPAPSSSRGSRTPRTSPRGRRAGAA